MAKIRDLFRRAFHSQESHEVSGREVVLRGKSHRAMDVTQRPREAQDIPVTRLVRADGRAPLPVTVEQTQDAKSEPPEPPVHERQRQTAASPEGKVYINIYTGEEFGENSVGRWHIYDKNYYNAVDPSCPKPTRKVESPRRRDPKSLARGKWD